jgi:type I restriction enzyme S subunit
MRKDWTESTLGEIAEVNMGQSPPGDTYNTEGIGLPFMQGSAEFGEHYPEPVKFCSAPAKIAEIGDLLLSVRAPVGDSNFANQRIAIGRGLATVRARTGADTHFLRLVIQLNTAGLLATSGTGMFSSITGKNLREFGVNLPPLEEQKRIVDVVSSVDAYIDALQQQADSARTARNAVLHGLLEVVADSPIRKLKDLTSKIGSGATPRGGESVYQKSGVTLIRSQNVHNALFLHEGLVAIDDSAAAALDGVSVEVNDVLINITGASVARTCLVDETVLPARVNQHVAILRTDSKVLLPGFLLRVLLGQQMNSYLLDISGSGTTRQAITKAQLESLEMAVPPISEQKRIVEIVSSMDDVIQSTEQAVIDAKNLRSGLLSDLLSGEHEIPASYDSLLGAA